MLAKVVIAALRRMAARKWPGEWLKEEWRKRGLLKRFQLSISGCLGPCDVPNVIAIKSESSSQWLAEITDFNQYRSWSIGLQDQLRPADC